MHFKKTNHLLIVFFFLTGWLFGQDSLSLKLIEDYNDWGWDSWVMNNGLITVTTVPAIGARIMQYDLDDHPSIYMNPAETGNTYTPSSGFFYPNFGGFKNWPAPQSGWNGGNWPPPPTLDYGSYEAVADTFPDSVCLTVTRPVEQWRTPNLRIQRRMTIYPNTSRVKVEQTIINEGDVLQQWSIWDITQSITQHGTSADYDNFCVYFPINPDSRYGESGVATGGSSQAWVGEVAPGIYGVKYRPDQLKLFADPHLGWICYVDELDGYAYAKTFDIFEGADYPDDGARIAVWVQNSPIYMEVEVMSPIVDLPAEGGSYTFAEDWWAAKVDGPIISVTEAGAVKSFNYDKQNECFTGEFGVFHMARARLEFTDSAGAVIDSSKMYPVTPLQTFILNDSTQIPANADSVYVVLLDDGGRRIGILVSKAVDDLLTVIQKTDNRKTTGFRLHPNYPNPFNNATKISYQLPKTSEVQLAIYNLLGQKIATLVSDTQREGNYQVKWDGAGYASSIYICRLTAGQGYIQSRKLIMMK
ncbi:MAG: T9SS type A sorting domain-containing protein [Calditrichaceae bacterium]|nr:T9SS type A sorting domain-containing protein [Calditrichaceae bacterium]RQV92728.1 MAG: T9SS C-terminal target domain-containing protein [Calditrichota bacterium]